MKKYIINKLLQLHHQPPTTNHQLNSGQIVLMLVLITIVGLTIALSLISRTVTDIRISSQIEQSSRAFSAAEAGVENALKGAQIGSPDGTVTLPDASGSYKVTQLGGDSGVLTFPLTSVGSIQYVWLMDHSSDGTSLDETSGYSYPASSSFDICWGTDPNIYPAITISLFYKTGNNYKVARSAYDKNASSRANNFTLPESGGNGYCDGNFQYKKVINPEADFGIDPASSKLLFLRIQPVYENTAISIKPSSALPSQGKIITSTGQTTTGVIRKIKVIQGYNVLPALLDFALFVEN